MYTIQLIITIFAIAVVIIYFLRRSQTRTYIDDQINIIRDLNETDLELEAYMAEYETFSSEKLIELSKSELPEKRLQAIREVLSQRDMTQHNLNTNF